MRMTTLRKAMAAAAGTPLESWEIVRFPAAQEDQWFAILVNGEWVSHGHHHLGDAINQALQRLDDRAHAAQMIEARPLVCA